MRRVSIHIIRNRGNEKPPTYNMYVLEVGSHGVLLYKQNLDEQEVVLGFFDCCAQLYVELVYTYEVQGD